MVLNLNQFLFNLIYRRHLNRQALNCLDFHGCLYLWIICSSGNSRQPGKLTIIGYTCEALYVRSVCKIRDLLWLSSSDLTSFDVEILPAQPFVELHTTLQRAPITEDLHDPSAETTVYSGQRYWISF